MTRRTHVGIAFLTSVLTGIPFVPVAFASLIPDVDYEYNFFSKLLFPFGNNHLEHRKSAHNFITLLVLVALAFILIPQYLVPLCLGFLLHIFADFLTVAGVGFFYPFSNKNFSLNETFSRLFRRTVTIKTGSNFDILLGYFCFAGAFAILYLRFKSTGIFNFNFVEPFFVKIK
ncbi:MAG: metal-dependent hydrolase [Nitrososphaeria archaeon]